MRPADFGSCSMDWRQKFRIWRSKTIICGGVSRIIHRCVFGVCKERFTVRVGDHYSALGTQYDGKMIWVWIGSHSDYDRLVGS